jgi:small GTP-binding protein
MCSSLKNNIKVLFIGNPRSGKTTFINKVNTGLFTYKYKPTKSIKITNISEDMWRCGSSNTNVIFNCWDCPGQERFGSLNETYYIGSSFIVICFSANNTIVEKSKNDLIEISQRVCPYAKIILMGTKSELGEFVNSNNNFIFIETSSIDCINIYSLFDKMYELIYDKEKSD